ncbi:hypothetical protein D3C85_895590 [compost metagenome]
MQVTVGFRHVDALVDRGDVGRTGKRSDDTTGAEDRQTAKNAQARIHGFQCQCLAVLDIDRDLETAAVAKLVSQSGQVFADHFARHRVDRGLADSQHQPGPGHGADAATGLEARPRFAAQAHLGVEQGTVGHVRIVTGVLEGSRFGAVLGEAAELQAHLHLFALGQHDFHRIGRCASQQQTRGGEAGGRGATAGGQATAQGGGLFGGFVTHRRVSSRPAR